MESTGGRRNWSARATSARLSRFVAVLLSLVYLLSRIGLAGEREGDESAIDGLALPCLDERGPN